MIRTTAYYYDLVGCTVDSLEVELPDGLTPRQMLVLADDLISQQGGGDEFGTYHKEVRIEGQVMVLDAAFGHGQLTRIYLCPPDPDQAKELATRELEDSE